MSTLPAEVEKALEDLVGELNLYHARPIAYAQISKIRAHFESPRADTISERLPVTRGCVKTSLMIAALQYSLEEHGDLPVHAAVSFLDDEHFEICHVYPAFGGKAIVLTNDD